MPVHDGSRSDQDEKFPPPGPVCSQRNPKQPEQASQSMVRSLRVQSQQLPTESQVLKDEVLRERQTLTIQPRKCLSDAIIARICRLFTFRKQQSTLDQTSQDPVLCPTIFVPQQEF